MILNIQSSSKSLIKTECCNMHNLKTCVKKELDENEIKILHFSPQRFNSIEIVFQISKLFDSSPWMILKPHMA